MSSNAKETSAVSPRQYSVPHVQEKDGKIELIALRITFRVIVQSRSGPSDHWLFTDSKRKRQGNRFGSNEELIAKAQAYFESKNETFYKKGIKKLKDLWAGCITLEG
ncbi:hypothetical protein TNCV_1401991 [Trichonephila clavipes]|nr:hypothetical protein TNCV_1401991 [Trichonephila clavipes]